MDALTSHELEAIGSLNAIEIGVFCRIGRGHDSAHIARLIGEPCEAVAKAKTTMYAKLGIADEPDEKDREAKAMSLCDRHYEQFKPVIGKRNQGRFDSYVLAIEEAEVISRSPERVRRVQRRLQRAEVTPIEVPENPLYGEHAAKAMSKFSERQQLLIWLAWKGVKVEQVAHRLDTGISRMQNEYRQIYLSLGYGNLAGRVKNSMLCHVYVQFRKLHPEIIEPPME